MTYVTRTIEYRNAVFRDQSQVLEDLTRKAWNSFSDSEGRTFDSDGGISHCGLRASEVYDGYAIHCARYTDNQSMGTISTNTSQSEVNVEELPPPKGKNFVNTDFMAIIKGNSVICLNCHVGAKRLIVYLKDLFERAQFPIEARKFSLVRVADFDKTLEIAENGVKRIDYNVHMTDLLESHMKEIAPQKKKLSTHMNESLEYMVGGIKTLKNIRESEKGILNVGMNIPSGDTDTAKQCIEDFAKQIVDEDEDESFTIHLRKGGQIIRSNELAVTKRIPLKPWTNSVDVFDAWRKMSDYMSEVEPKYRENRRGKK